MAKNKYFHSKMEELVYNKIKIHRDKQITADPCPVSGTQDEMAALQKA